MRTRILLCGAMTCVLATLLVACSSSPRLRSSAPLPSCRPSVRPQSELSRTGTTTVLYDNLACLSGALLWGVHNQSVPAAPQTSDGVHDISGRYPALVEYTYSDLSDARHFDPAYVATQVEAQYRSGGVAGIDWLPRDPVTGGPTQVRNDPGVQPAEDLCAQVLPGGPYSTAFDSDIDQLAGFLDGLRAGGVKVPVLLRILPEQNGDWFWWGTAHCSSEEYVSLYRLVASRLASDRSGPVDNVITVWAPAGLSPGSSDQAQWVSAIEATYPGNRYVDVVGVDAYDDGSTLPMPSDKTVVRSLKGIVKLAASRHKMPAMTEGENKDHTLVDSYWTGYVDTFQSRFPKLRAIRYALVWTPTWAPSAQDTSADRDNFVAAIGNRYLIMRGDGIRQWYCPGFSCRR